MNPFRALADSAEFVGVWLLCAAVLAALVREAWRRVVRS